MKGTPEENMIKYYNVYPGIDIRYTVYEDLLLEDSTSETFSYDAAGDLD